MPVLTRSGVLQSPPEGVNVHRHSPYEYDETAEPTRPAAANGTGFEPLSIGVPSEEPLSSTEPLRPYWMDAFDDEADI
jgi:hypothetical protein